MRLRLELRAFHPGSLALGAAGYAGSATAGQVDHFFFQKEMLERAETLALSPIPIDSLPHIHVWDPNLGRETAPGRCWTVGCLSPSTSAKQKAGLFRLKVELHDIRTMSSQRLCITCIYDIGQGYNSWCACRAKCKRRCRPWTVKASILNRRLASARSARKGV